MKVKTLNQKKISNSDFYIVDNTSIKAIGNRSLNANNYSNTKPICRFLNQNIIVNLHTAKKTTKYEILEWDNFSLEDGVDSLTGMPKALPVFQFLHQNSGVYLYTISPSERNALEELDTFSFAGTAFFAYETKVSGAIPIYLYCNPFSGAHFYTPWNEKRDTLAMDLSEFQFAGIAYYALAV